MSLRNASDLTQRKTDQTKYFDHVRLRGLAAQGALGKAASASESISQVVGGTLFFDSSGNVVGVNTIPLVVTITPTNRNISTLDTTLISFVFSQPINIATFTLSDINVSNGSLSSFTKVTDSLFSCIFTPSSIGISSITIPSNIIQTIQGINNESASSSITVSSPPSLVPTITSDKLTLTNTQIANITITFNMPINTSSFIWTDLIIQSGSISSFNKISPTITTFIFTPQALYTGSGGILLDGNNVNSQDGLFWNIAASLILNITSSVIGVLGD